MHAQNVRITYKQDNQPYKTFGRKSKLFSKSNRFSKTTCSLKFIYLYFFYVNATSEIPPYFFEFMPLKLDMKKKKNKTKASNVLDLFK